MNTTLITGSPTHPWPGQVQEAAAGGLGEGHLGLQGRDAEADPQGGAERFGPWAVARGLYRDPVEFQSGSEKNTWTEMFFLGFTCFFLKIKS